jgi:hypothetical protein
MGQPDLLNQFLRTILRHASVQLERQHHVLAHGQRRNQVERLKYEADVPAPKERALLVVHARDVLVVDEHVAGRRLVDAADQIQQRALAAAAAPEQHDEFAARELNRNIFEDRALHARFFIAARDVGKADKRRIHFSFQILD